MDKRTLLAVALSTLVIMVFSYFSPSQKPVQPPVGVPSADKPAQTEKQETTPGSEKLILPVDVPAEVKEITVDTDLYSAIFTTKGGTLKKWDLKKHSYKDKNNKEMPVSLVSPGIPTPPVYILLDGELKDLPSTVNYSVDKDSVIFDSNSNTLTFYYADSSRGLSIKKVFTFYKDSYKVDLATEVKGVQSYKVALGSGFGVFEREGTWVHIGPVLLRDADKIDLEAGNLEDIGTIKRWLTGRKSSDTVEYKGNIRWIAEEDKYFASALVSLSKNTEAVIWDRGNAGDNKNKGADIAYVVSGEKGDFLLYAGPKRYELLKTFNVGLEHIIDFGFFSIIARPLFWLLKFFYNVMGNYGWAIIVLTIVTRIPFIPLINKGQKSMKKLQEIQPHMTALKEKYKNDPQKMQKEVMEIYRKHKVNPMGGCLPMLIQMPVFFALYKILLIAIELRGTPFIWWIKDLSAPDRLPIGIQIPYVGDGIPVLTLLMGASMFIQQKMTPSAMDPKQAKMMMLMPVIFTFMFLTFPSGLVIYWLVSNVLGIVQQYYVNKKAAAPAK